MGTRCEVRRYGEVELVLGWDEYDLFIEGPVDDHEVDWLRAIEAAKAEGLKVLDGTDEAEDDERVRLLLAEEEVA
jgi:hypothetical protein